MTVTVITAEAALKFTLNKSVFFFNVKYYCLFSFINNWFFDLNLNFFGAAKIADRSKY